MDSPSESNDLEGTLPKHGGYRKLRSFQTAQLVYDATVIFCDRFIDKRSRTHDQMVQAARSGVQNIAEGSVASGASKKSEIFLTNVAKASLEELRLDYEDFLRQRGLQRWDKASPEALQVRQLYRIIGSTSSDSSDRSDRSDTHPTLLELYQIRTAPPQSAANTLLCMIHQATSLLGRQIERLEQDFQNHGGLTERLYKMRSRKRAHDAEAGGQLPGEKTPACPQCGKPMRWRTARQGKFSGQQFWGCSAYPECKGIRQVERSDSSDSSD